MILVVEILDCIHNDYVCKIFIDKEEINKYLNFINNKLNDRFVARTDFIYNIVL